MLYSVHYKKVDSFFWKKINKVKGDFIAQDLPNSPRVLVLDNESRIEIPVHDMMFKFSQERFFLIKKNMDTEAGTVIPIK